MSTSTNTPPYLYETFEAYFRSTDKPSLASFVTKHKSVIATYHKRGESFKNVWTTRYAKAHAYYFNSHSKKSKPSVDQRNVDWAQVALEILENDHLEQTSGNSSSTEHSTNSNSSGTAKVSLNQDFLDGFRKTYISMKEDQKWVLKSGKIVEDVLFNFGMKAQYEHMAHSFIVDIKDPMLKEEFTAAELKEIRELDAHPLPPCPAPLLQYLNQYAQLKTISELVAQTRKRNYDFNTEFDLDWAQFSFLSALRLFQGNFFPITDQTEADLIQRVWPFINTCFDNTKISTRTGEMESKASSTRINLDRSSADRKKHGHRADFLFKSCEREFGCAEVGKKDDEDAGSKELHELGLKCPKMMKDQLVQLVLCVPADRTKDLLVVGFVMMGLKFRAVVLDRPSTYICRYSRSSSLMFPAVEETVGSQLGALLALMAQVKQLVCKTYNIINEPLPISNQSFEEVEEPDTLTMCPPSPRRRKGSHHSSTLSS